MDICWTVADHFLGGTLISILYYNFAEARLLCVHKRTGHAYARDELIGGDNDGQSSGFWMAISSLWPLTGDNLAGLIIFELQPLLLGDRR